MPEEEQDPLKKVLEPMTPNNVQAGQIGMTDEQIKQRSAEIVAENNYEPTVESLAMLVVDAALEEEYGTHLLKTWREEMFLDSEKFPYNEWYEETYLMSWEQADDATIELKDIIGAVEDTYRDVLIIMVLQKHRDLLLQKVGKQ